MSDYRNPSYFSTILSRIKSVFNKVGSAPWYEPALEDKGSSLSAEEVHDNFQILTAGELNLNLRTTTLESGIVDSSQNVDGTLAFSGFAEKEGELYGGSPYVLNASVDIDPDPVNLAAPTAKFYIAEGLGIIYLDENSQVDNDNTLWNTINVNFNANVSGLPAYLNGKLVNDGSPFEFSTVSISGTVATVCDWGGVSPANFDISFNDEPYQTVNLTATNTDVPSAANYINSQILAKFPNYNDSFEVIADGSSIKFTANSSSTSKRLTRVRIKENPNNSILGSSGIGWSVGGTSIFDFSHSLEFFLTGRKMSIRGLGAFFYAVIKDDATNPLFDVLKLSSYIKKIAPFYRLFHTSYPVETMVAPLSYGGHLHVAKLTSTSPIEGPIDSVEATIGTLNVTTLNAAAVSIPNADITLADLTADSVTAPLATITTLGVSGVATLAEANITTLSGTSVTADSLAVTSFTADNATVTNLAVAGGSITTSSVNANSISAAAASFTSAIISDLQITKATRSPGRLYTTPVNSSVSTDAPTTTNTGAPLLSYDGWFRATVVHAGSVILTSLRALKKNITPFTQSALEIINETEIVSYEYRSDDAATPKVGFIADDTNSLLSGPNHDTMDTGNNIGLLLKAVQELSEENRILKDRLDRIESYLKL